MKNKSKVLAPTYFLEDLKKSISKMALNITDKITDKTTMNDLEEIIEHSDNMLGYFLAVIKPNLYMMLLLKYLSIFGATSIYQVALFTDEKDITQSYTNQLRRQGHIIEKLKIVKIEILAYTYPSPTKIYITSKCTKQQKQECIDFYEGYRLRYEQKQKPKEVVYIHTKAPKEKEKPSGIIACQPHKLASCKECG